MIRVSKWTVLFLLVLGIAAFFRAQYLFAESIWVDETVYAWQGYRLLHTPSLMATSDYYGNTPFPLLFIAFFNMFTSDRFIAARLTAYFFSLVGIILAYLMGRELKDEMVGLLAALLVTFNPLHWFIGSRTLMDLPEATMVSLSVYLLLRYEKHRTARGFLVLTGAIIATVLTKLPALLVVPGIILYYVMVACSRPTETITYIKGLTSKQKFGGALLGIGFSGLVVTKINFLWGLLQTMTPRWDFIQHLPFMFTSSILLFLAIGIVLGLYYRNWNALALVCVMISFLLAFSIFPAEPDPRHIAPIIPLGIVIAAFGYFELAAMVKLLLQVPHLEWGFLLLGSLITIPLFSLGVALNVDKSYAFTGYNEAGQWFADNLPPDTLAYVSSQGPIRLFSGLGYITERGPIRQIQAFGDGSIPDFSKATLPIYLHIDIWERGPEWSYPLTDQKLQYLTQQGFRVAKVVQRKFPTTNGIQDVPAHLILVKEK
ncbi:glycosyltransferase family 39 protein [Candidatus Woesearchaeota archaeon]|nr:glycosyltransferase family 39 protein [Candidatus Woesearchaeota archaeon]